MTTGKTIALTTWTFVSKVLSLLFKTLSMFVIAFLPRSKCLLISCLQSPSAVILEPKKIKSVTVFILSREHPGMISFSMDWLDLFAVQGTLKSLLQHNSSKTSILRCSAFLIFQLSHPYMNTGKTIALTRQTFVGKVMSLLWDLQRDETLGERLKDPHPVVFFFLDRFYFLEQFQIHSEIERKGARVPTYLPT